MAQSTDTRRGASRWVRSLLALGLVALAAFVVGLLLGHNTPGSSAVAAPPAAQAEPEVPSDYARRVVARIYGSEEITREDLGEYLIARHGAEAVELLINKRVIEHVCHEKGVTVSTAEVDASLDDDCRGLGVDRKAFVGQILKHYKKTLYEWKEDVIRPRLLLTKVCEDRVKIADEDLHKAFEGHYGEKVDVRILLYPPGENQLKVVRQIYEKLRGPEGKVNETAWEQAARQQPNSQLAMLGGKIDPISHHSGDDHIEKVAFSLRPGELSEVIETPEGYLIMKCVALLAPDRTKIFETERPALTREVHERKLQVEIGKVFEEMKKQAQPVQYLTNKQTEAKLKHDVEQELQSGPAPIRVPGQAPSGN